MGYRVFLSNMAEGDFVQITTTWINDTVYHYGLNLNTLSEEVYFTVKAVDFRENMSQLHNPAQSGQHFPVKVNS